MFAAICLFGAALTLPIAAADIRVQPQDTQQELPVQNNRVADSVELRLAEQGAEHSAYISGYADGSFAPDRAITRAEGAQLIYSLVENPGDERVYFYDVPTKAWYFDAVSTLAAGGVVADDGYFRPNDELTRGEFVSMLGEFFPDGEYECAYTDLDENSPYYEAAAKATHFGWISGFPDGSFGAERSITRAQAVTAVNRVIGRIADTAAIDGDVVIPIFSDVFAGHWAYYDITEAAIDHSLSTEIESETWISYDVEATRREPNSTYLIDGCLYATGPDGLPVTDAYAGALYFGPDGRYTCGDSEVDGFIRDIILEIYDPSLTREELLHAAYNHTRDGYTYLRRNYYQIGDTGWELENARVMLQTKRGNCYCYAAVFYYLSRNLGYDATAISGVVGSSRSPHGWVEIDFDGVTNIFDTELEMSYREKGIYYYDFYMMPYSRAPWQYVKG